MAKRKRGGRGSAPVNHAPPCGFDDIVKLYDAGDLKGARERLMPLAQRPNPNHYVVELLAQVAEQLKDWRTYLFAVEIWHQRAPNNIDAVLALGGAYMLNMRPVLALRYLEQAVERWPADPEIGQTRRIIADLKPSVAEMLDLLGLTGEEGTAIAALHEELQSLMEQGRTREARVVGQRLLKQRPGFVPALNNLTLVNLIDGSYEQARRAADEALAVEPDNLHARANLVRLLVVSGDLAGARAAADRLLELDHVEGDQWLKLAEALTFVGDYAGVLDVFERAKKAKALDQPGSGMLFHLAGVAALSQGDERAARRHWAMALKREPGLSAAVENLADLRQPARVRNAPWALAFPNWVSRALMTTLQAELGTVSALDDAERAAKRARRLLRQHPELHGLIPVLLERGDPYGRELAIHLAGSSQDAGLLAALREFAGSRHGPDHLRQLALQLLHAAGVISPAEPIDMWVDGVLRTVRPMAVELHDERIAFPHSTEVTALMPRLFAAVAEEDLDAAEDVLRRILAIEPDAPDARQILGQIYSLTNRPDEAESLLRGLVEEQPDFVLARVSLAQTLTRRRRYAEAHALLDPLQQRPSFSLDDYSAFVGVMIELLLAEKNKQAAQTWFDVLLSFDPEYPAIEDLARQLGQGGKK